MAPNRILATIISTVVVLFHATCALTVLLTLSYAVWYGEAPLELSSVKHRAPYHSAPPSKVTDSPRESRIQQELMTDTSTNVGTTPGTKSGLSAATKKSKAINSASHSSYGGTCAQQCCQINWGGPHDNTLLECANSTSQQAPQTCAEGKSKDGTRSTRVTVVTMITSEVFLFLSLLSLQGFPA